MFAKNAEKMGQPLGVQPQAQVMVRRNQKPESDSYRNQRFSPKTTGNAILNKEKVYKNQSLGGASLQNSYHKNQQIAGISANFSKQKVTVNQDMYHQR